MASVAIEALTFKYPNSSVPALDNVSIEVREGEFLLVIGPSGCGKSTLLRHLKTVLSPHGERSGSVRIDGRELSEVPEREQAGEIGFVFQHPDDQIVTDKVWHELAFGLESLGADRNKMRLRVAEMASYFGLEDVFYKDAAELSGGQKQLLNLASVMTLSPKILVFDEPTSQLDPIAAFDFLTTVKKLNTELGMTVILSEHRLEEAMPFADRVLVMESGRAVICDTPRAAAEMIYASGSAMLYAMPAAARLSLGLGMGCAALTVNEGRRLLLSMGLEKGSLPAGEFVPRGGEALISAKGLFFRYEKDGADVLKGLDVDLRKGEIMGLVGGNGAGKSTLLALLSGDRQPYRGHISVRGKRMKSRFSAFEARIGLLGQDPRTLFSTDTVRAELEKAANARDKSTAEERINAVISLMDIGDILDRNPFDISGGEQQRTAIAIILLTEPEALLLDEPTKGMDAGVKRALGERLRALRDEGLAILIVTHDTEFCAEYADRVGLMFDGSIAAEDNARGFFSRNTFYTTAANRIARDIYPNALLIEEVIGHVRGKKG